MPPSAPPSASPPLPLPAEERQRRRLLLRAAGRSLMDDTLASPCVSICQVDGESGLCIGCSRSVGEITDWALLTAPEKQRVLAELPQRAPRPGRSAPRGNSPAKRVD